MQSTEELRYVGRDPLLGPGIAQSPCSQDGVALALLLYAASPGRARDFALVMHERAATGHDDRLTEYWATVLSEFRRIERALPTTRERSVSRAS